MLAGESPKSNMTGVLIEWGGWVVETDMHIGKHHVEIKVKISTVLLHQGTPKIANKPLESQERDTERVLPQGPQKERPLPTP